jgi:demethylspheroidene O-methyltransferase
MTGSSQTPALRETPARPARGPIAMPNFSDFWLKIRNRLLSDPRFQRRAAATPLVRIIARQKARGMFDLCSGFVYSQVLLASVRLDLFRKLQAEPLTVDAVAAQCDLPQDSARRLLEAAASLDLLTRRKDGRYGLGMHGAALLANPGIEAMIEHNALLYEDLRDPVEFLRNPDRETALSRYWAYARAADPSQLSDDDIRGYSALMSASQPLVSGEILDAYPFAQHMRLLDVGGGEGRFLAAAGARFPKLELALFDLPAVAARARQKLDEGGFGSRAQTFGGNFFRDDLPAGADIVTLVRILHDHDDEKAELLLSNIRKALPPGGRLLIAEPLSDTPGAEPMGDAYFGFYLMAMRSGRPRTLATIEGMLRRAGFSRSETLPTRIPLQTSLIIAHS